MVLFDATMLVDLIQQNKSKETKDKITGLVQDLQKTRTKILVPTPALAEFLAGSGENRDQYQEAISTNSSFVIAPFDNRSALECSLMIDEAISKNSKKELGKTWAKAKFDWQIMAIAKVNGVSKIYSNDEDINKMGKRFGIPVIKTNELPIPDWAKQGTLNI
jgi:predicted nucleic acid-binding protein